MKSGLTERGFGHLSFVDAYGAKCSLQKSSRVEPAVWLGVDDADPKIMAKDAACFDIQTNKTTGWIPYPVPKAVLLNTRMHLSQDQVRALLPALQKFAETGELPVLPEENWHD